MAYRHPFADLPGTAANHFKLYFYAAVSQVLASAAGRTGSIAALHERVPAVAGYAAELVTCGVPVRGPRETAGWWQDVIARWEAATTVFLPIRAVRGVADLDHEAMTLACTVGLLEEDASFAPLFELLSDDTHQDRVSAGMLIECWAEASDRGEVRARLRHLQDLGLLHVVNPEAPTLQRVLDVPGALWDALRGDQQATPTQWAHFVPLRDLPDGDALIVDEPLRAMLRRIPALVRSGEIRSVIARGPQHNGRRTVLAALARALGRGTLEIGGLSKADDERWRLAALLTTALHAFPIVVCDPGPGETFDLPRPAGYDGPIGVVTGRAGGVAGPGAERALRVTIEMPDPAARRAHWRRAFGPKPVADLDVISERFRMTAGHIRRAAALATSYAALDGRESVTAGDVLQAARALNRQSLDSLASPVATGGDWSHLALRDDTLRDLLDLELRCRNRERLLASLREVSGPQSSCGVRALFRGPSGTGKTLAARLLASVLAMDLYRLDLSSVVNKYIGETEKNLDRVLSRAEELDVILLLDEGDALLTQRTNVQSSNDRYANLETNYLLQRLESFEGILIVTTNAGDRIDPAFERRLDVVIDFHAPQAPERWEIWQTQLPTPHAINDDFLNEVAMRCALSGGQIRNAVLHASLLALDGPGGLTSDLLDTAIRREYRKAGSVCPLRAAPDVMVRG